MSTQQESSKPNLFGRVSRYFKDLRGELKKVVWPSKKQVSNNTLIVLGVVVVSSIIVGGFDAILTFIMRLLVGFSA